MPDKVNEGTRIVKTACRACIANCGVLAYVENGRVVKLEGNPDDPMSKGRMCAKGLAGIQALYNPNRIKYPMRRIGERGSGQWERISWDEALDEIAHKLMDTREKYGAETVFCSTGGGGNPEVWSAARFSNVFGTPNWFEPGCAQCYLPRVLAYTMMYGGVDPSIADSNALELYFPDDTPIKTLVMWGTAPSYSCPASGGGAVADLRARGVKTVVIDPRFTPDAAKATVWLPIRPGTDVALQLAWIRYIIEHKLYDDKFVDEWTNLPYLVDLKTKMFVRENGEMIRGKRDGCKTAFDLLWDRCEPYTLERAAEICWLDAAKIEEAIRLYAENTPSGLALGVATDQSVNSVQAAMAACTLDILLGNVEKPGALLQRFRTSGVLKVPNYPVPVATKLLPPEMLKKRLGGNEYKGLHIWYAGHPSSILDAILTGEPYQPRVWIDRSGNKLGVVADAAKWERAIEKLDFIVHIFVHETSFSQYADILLPAAEWLETDMVVETCNTLVARQAAVHLWETMDETLIWSKIAKRCAELGHEGCQKAFDAEFMGEDLPYWDSMDEFFNHLTPAVGMTWKEMKEKAPFEYMPKDEWRSYYVYLEPDENGNPKGFNTPSGKLEVYLESMITLSRTGAPFAPTELPPASKDYDPLPYFTEPYESPNQERSRDYPLVYTGGRIPYYHHSTGRNIPALREIYPVPELTIHCSDAEKYGLTNGEWAWVESPRGKIRAKVRATEGIRPGVVHMERFWAPETIKTDTHGWREMNVNILTSAAAPFNDVVGTYTLRGLQVKVYAADGPPDGIWEKPGEFKSWLPLPVNAVERQGD